MTASALPSDAEPPLRIPLASRRHERAALAQKLQHLVPAGALLFTGVQGLLAHARGLALSLALFEIAFGALLVRALLRETHETLAARRAVTVAADDPGAGQVEPSRDRGEDLDARHASGPNWTEILVAAVLATEALEHWHATGHLPRPTLLLAAMTLVLALAHGAIARRVATRRSLRVDEDGVWVGGRPFRGFHARWQEIEDLRIGAAEAVIVARGRRGPRTRRIDLADLRNAAAVRAALLDASARLARRRAATAPS